MGSNIALMNIISTLTTFINFLITDKEAQHLWILPDYINEIEYVSEFNDKNFGDFLDTYFMHKYTPQEKKNASKSKGYDYYYNNGDISTETHNTIINHPEFLKYKKYIDI